MGCLSSKFETRSPSFRGVLNKSMQRSANSLAALEDLATSKNINDQLLSLVRTSSKVSRKLRSGSFSKGSPEPEIEHNSSLTNDTWEFSSSLEQEAQEKQGREAAMTMPQSPRDDLAKGSKSCHLFSEDNSLESFDGGDEGRFNQKGITGDRSFHTVEEYDAMVERSRFSIAEQAGPDCNEAFSSTAVQLNAHQSSSFSSNDEMDDKEGYYKTEETSVSPGLELESRTYIANPNGSNATEGLDVGQHCSNRHIFEKGFKRKSIAKGLHSLEIPQRIEFQTVASLKEWLHADGQIYSPGRYVAPKFGSYDLPNSGTANECSDTVIFNPELVAALEECMQQLEAEAEAETIIEQMAKNLVDESLMES